jgi:membrane-bound lytic murein transglycosylase A
MRCAFFLFAFFLSACAGPPVQEEGAPLTLKPVSFSALPGWGDDTLAEAVPALQRSCERILRRPPAGAYSALPQAGTNADWQGICLDLRALNTQNPQETQLFFERHFTPFEVRAGTQAEGLFTGYYEASLKGSRTRHDQYRYPLHTRPGDLVMVDLGEFREELKGQRIAGRVKEGSLKPYEDRAAIVAGRWPHNDKVLVWVDDPVDAFFVQIQGSGIVELDDGSVMRIGYAGQNGHIYYAIGRELIARGELTKDGVSMQAIRQWLAANPDKADEIMNTNRSYVFFEESKQDGAVGGEGVILTPGRSLAIDHSEIPYGAPLWVDIAEPVPGVGDLRRLMLAQDTGGAIRGAVRGDVFWGYGDRAESIAGPMKAQGRYWLLLPRVPTPPKI